MIFFDEAGNSGSNLLDPNQPTYLLLSHDFSIKEANEMLLELDKVSHAKELHFKNLKKYERSRQAIIKCINHPSINYDRVFYYMAHKEFMIVIHIVDQLIELVLDDGGIDIYKRGLNLSTANLIYIMGNNVWDKALFKKVCHNFVEWIRTNDDSKGDIFYSSVNTLYNSVKDENDRHLVGLIAVSAKYRDIVKEAYSKYTLDATLSCFIAHCNFWAKRYPNSFDVIFDNSKQIEYWKDMIGFLIKNLPEQEVGYGSRKHKYPLLIKKMSLVDSATDRQIQLADIMASSLNFAYANISRDISDPFGEQVLASRLGAVTKNIMWPSTEITPEELNMTDESGTNPLDYLAEHLYKRRSSDE
jgi:hypothetical protein